MGRKKAREISLTLSTILAWSRGISRKVVLSVAPRDIHDRKSAVVWPSEGGRVFRALLVVCTFTLRANVGPNA